MARWADLIDLDDDVQTLWSWGESPTGEDATQIVRRSGRTASSTSDRVPSGPGPPIWFLDPLYWAANTSLESELSLDDVHLPWARGSTLESACSQDAFASCDDFGAMKMQMGTRVPRQSSEPDIQGCDKGDLDGPDCPRLATHGEERTRGSRGHPLECIPCAFYCFRKAGCASSLDCQYCHLEHLSKSFQRKADWKQKATKNRQKRRHAASAAVKLLGGPGEEEEDKQLVLEECVQQG